MYKLWYYVYYTFENVHPIHYDDTKAHIFKVTLYIHQENLHQENLKMKTLYVDFKFIYKNVVNFNLLLFFEVNIWIKFINLLFKLYN